ncbi:efflux RND transporter periplasmic adaptor subunit [Candidatus Binatus sp.]|uniref:efflux RND transporter periplasmic adaptor subunit n=1 Tax=Candidatus Binatus sp. TaxID=2811406 RepID=UPI003BB182BE
MEASDSHKEVSRKDHHRHAIGWFAAMIAVIVGSAAVVVSRTYAISTQRSELDKVAEAGPHVLVTHPQAASAERRLTLPATIQGYVETPVFAKIAGYLKEIRVDKGDRVRKGQVIAILESPELDQQVADAKDNLWLQTTTDKRDAGLVLKHGVSQQIADNSHGAALQADATYKQLLALQSYEVITAPFDGIVTARYVDPGVLVAQTITPTSTYLLSHLTETASPLVQLATLSPIRVYASAPQDVAKFIDDGTPTEISVVQRPGQDISAKVTRHPQALDPATRMMLVEADIPNSDGALYPGMYGTMSLAVKVPTSAPLVPDDELIFCEGKVFVPLVQNSTVHLAPVTLGFDNGYSVEATSGIAMNDLIALNLGQSAIEGERVQPVQQATK